VYESAQRKMGAEHWMTAAFRGNLGQSLMLQNRHADAEPHLLAAYEGLKSSLGADHPRTQSAASDLVRLYDEWGKPDEAEKYRANTPAAE
jgi:Flp pilus assembly protein TadD